MAAVQLEKLKNQLKELSWKFTRPADFLRDLKGLFEFYSNQVMKPGELKPETQPTLSYNVPHVILNQLELELEPFINENPSAALSLADVLWADIHLEPKLFASSVLRLIPEPYFIEVIKRINRWSSEDTDNRSLEALFVKGAQSVRVLDPGLWFELVQSWLTSSDVRKNLHGLQMMIPASKERDFENIPKIFLSLTPFMEDPPPVLQNILIDLLINLAERSPAETNFFLRHCLFLYYSKKTIRLVRRLLPHLDQASQTSLRLILNQSSNS